MHGRSFQTLRGRRVPEYFGCTPTGSVFVRLNEGCDQAAMASKARCLDITESLLRVSSLSRANSICCACARTAMVCRRAAACRSSENPWTMLAVSGTECPHKHTLPDHAAYVSHDKSDGRQDGRYTWAALKLRKVAARKIKCSGD